MMTKNSPKLAQKFTCEPCDYGCSKESDFKKHLATRKHLHNDNSQNNDDGKNRKKYVCECGKEYNHRQGLYTHKKKCDILSYMNNPSENVLLDASTSEIKVLTNLVLEVMKNNTEILKQNTDLQKQVLDVCKNGIVNNNTINNNNSHNKTFNLNFFLNEQCKDAMNLMDFVNSFQLQISDMERIGELGYVEGISNIIMEKLNGMDIYKRPIHCSDAKRETMHIKDNNVWEKDTVNNDKMRKAIKHITWLNTKLLFAWAAEHPGVVYSDHKLNDKYCEMIVEAMGGKRNKTIEEGETKIIKKISKMVIIDKSIF